MSVILKHLLATSAQRSRTILDEGEGAGETGEDLALAEMRGTMFLAGGAGAGAGVSGGHHHHHHQHHHQQQKQQHGVDLELEREVSKTHTNKPVGLTVQEITHRSGICQEDVCSTLDYMIENHIAYDENNRILTFANGHGWRPARVARVILKDHIISKYLKEAAGSGSSGAGAEDTTTTTGAGGVDGEQRVKCEFLPEFCDKKCLSWQPSSHSSVHYRGISTTATAERNNSY